MPTPTYTYTHLYIHTYAHICITIMFKFLFIPVPLPFDSSEKVSKHTEVCLRRVNITSFSLRVDEGTEGEGKKEKGERVVEEKGEENREGEK
jgi:hypothetical protein